MLSFHVRLGLPSVKNKISSFHCLRRAKELYQVRSLVKCCVIWQISAARNCYHLAQTPIWRATLFLAARHCLFTIFAATLHTWRPFLHPQSEVQKLYISNVSDVNMLISIQNVDLLFSYSNELKT